MFSLSVFDAQFVIICYAFLILFDAHFCYMLTRSVSYLDVQFVSFVYVEVDIC